MSLTVFLAICVLGLDFMIFVLFQWLYGEKNRNRFRRSAARRHRHTHRHLCITFPAEVIRRGARPALTGAQSLVGRASCINQTAESRRSNIMIAAIYRSVGASLARKHA